MRLTAFSTSVGHRPTGLQAAQAKLFVDRFKSDFKEMAMQKTVLPCSADGLPFVATDGSLPCSSLSTFNALKYLQEKPEELARAEPGAKEAMEKIFHTGVQVEWMEFATFLEWQLYVESASVQSTVQVTDATCCRHCAEVSAVLPQRSATGR